MLSELCYLENKVWYAIPVLLLAKMSQKDSRDDSKGPASTQKLNNLYLHFERGDSQHKNIPINTPSKPPYRALRSFISSYIFKYFDRQRGSFKRTQGMTEKGPASTQKFNYLYLHFGRGDLQLKSVAIIKPSKPFCRAFEIFAV